MKGEVKPITKKFTSNDEFNEATASVIIERNGARKIKVTDETGAMYASTYRKRADGLVKHGRARWIAGDTVCLSCPPNKLEDDMANISLDEYINKYNAENNTEENTVVATTADGDEVDWELEEKLNRELEEQEKRNEELVRWSEEKERRDEELVRRSEEQEHRYEDLARMAEKFERRDDPLVRASEEQERRTADMIRKAEEQEHRNRTWAEDQRRLQEERDQRDRELHTRMATLEQTFQTLREMQSNEYVSSIVDKMVDVIKDREVSSEEEFHWFVETCESVIDKREDTNHRILDIIENHLSQLNK